MIAKYTPAGINFKPATDSLVELPGLTRTMGSYFATIKGYQHKRGAAVLATYLLKDMPRVELAGGSFVNSSTPLAFYVLEEPMAAQAATMTDVQLDGETYTFQFGPEGFPKTLADLAAMRAELQSQDIVKKVAMVNAFAKSNGGADMTQMVGIPVTIDFDANQPIQIGE